MFFFLQAVIWGNSNLSIILTITCFALMVLQSNMGKTKFMQYYIYFMIVEAIISIICYVYCFKFNYNTMPGYMEYKVSYENAGYSITYLTPYYTIGWLATSGFFKRNAGIFWEPGAHAIYLLLAIIFVLQLRNKQNKKMSIAYLIVLGLGLITTLSTTGYMAAVIVVLYYVLSKKQKKYILPNVLIIMITLLFLFITLKQGDVFDKIINQTGSYGTRYNDTYYGFKIALQKWFFGRGLFTDISAILAKYKITTMSNGYIGLMIRIGIPAIIAYTVIMFKGIQRFFGEKGMLLFLLIVIFAIFFNSESLYAFPVFISFMFYWKSEEQQKGVMYNCNLTK